MNYLVILRKGYAECQTLSSITFQTYSKRNLSAEKIAENIKKDFLYLAKYITKGRVDKRELGDIASEIFKSSWKEISLIYSISYREALEMFSEKYDFSLSLGKIDKIIIFEGFESFLNGSVEKIEYIEKEIPWKIVEIGINIKVYINLDAIMEKNAQNVMKYIRRGILLRNKF